MINDLLIHPATQAAINRYLVRPGAPLMLVGSDGSGKFYLAKQVVQEGLALKSQTIESNPNCLIVKRAENKQDITIEQIRNVTRFLRLKSPGNKPLRRAVLIIDSQDMNEEAQNALLKALEEPASDVLFILTVPSTRSVLPTVASRCQLIEVRPISLNQALDYFTAKRLAADIKASWLISGGRPGLLRSLFDSEGHELKSSVEHAKKTLSLSRYERMLELDKLGKDGLQQFLDALYLLLVALHHNSVSKGNRSGARKLLKNRKLVKRLQKLLSANTAPKMIVDELILNLSI